jgi:hypothetical protein
MLELDLPGRHAAVVLLAVATCTAIWYSAVQKEIPDPYLVCNSHFNGTSL